MGLESINQHEANLIPILLVQALHPPAAIAIGRRSMTAKLHNNRFITEPFSEFLLAAAQVVERKIRRLGPRLRRKRVKVIELWAGQDRRTRGTNEKTDGDEQKASESSYRKGGHLSISPV